MKTLSLLALLLLIALPVRPQEFDGHTHDILKVKFNREASQLLSYSAGDGWLCLWDVKTGQLLWRTKTEFIQKGEEHYTLTSFAFSRDQQLIASGSGNGTVQLWNAKTGRVIWRVDAHKDSVSAVEFSPDGSTVVSAATPSKGDGALSLIKVHDGQIIKRLSDKSCTVVALAFNDGGKLLTGNLDGSVSEWDLHTGTRTGSEASCRQKRGSDWEISFTSDLHFSAKRTGEAELTVSDTGSNTTKKLEASGYRVYSVFSRDGSKLVVSNDGGFTFYDLTTGKSRKVDEFSRTGSTIDLSADGVLFAEGGSWGNARIQITNLDSGKSWLVGSTSGQRVAPYEPTDLEVRLARERDQKQRDIGEAKARRDKQAGIDAAKFGKHVYITFEHYGEMVDPGQQRMMESGEPNKSKIKKSETTANAVWFRLHNDSPFPVEIPTLSMYRPNPNCSYTFPGGNKILGLCSDREISVWHSVENQKGKQIPYGFDFGSSAVLLPKTSVLFAVPRGLFKNGNAITFGFTFQNETDEDEITDYGNKIVLKFRGSDLPSASH